MDEPKYIEWDARRDELLMHASVSAQEIIDRIEGEEARGLSLFVEEDRDHRIQMARLKILQFLRSKKAKDSALILENRHHWRDLVAEFRTALLFFSGIPKRFHNDTCTEFESLLMYEKSRQFLFQLSADEREAIFHVVWEDLERESDEYYQGFDDEVPPLTPYETIELVGDAQEEAIEALKKHGYQDTGELPGGAEIFTILDFEIRDRL